MRSHRFLPTAVTATAVTVVATGLVPWWHCALAAAFVLTALGVKRIS
jgi:hypothetical protein